MKKFYVFIFISIIGYDASAAWAPKFGSNDSCIVEYKNSKRQFHFCGNSQNECAGYKVKKYSKEWTHSNGENFTSAYDSTRKFFCCNKNNAAQGVWKEGTQWYTKDEIAKKQLTNGTCNYRKRITICGDEESTDCDTPDACNAGAILRNNACVVPCNGTTAFESATSNTCIECETTAYQGIGADTICVKCDSGTQFFNKKTKKCISKDSMTTYSKETMKKCFGCPGNETFKKCVKILNQPQSTRNATEYKEIAKECRISD